MNRRDFLKSSLTGLLGSAFLSSLPGRLVADVLKKQPGLDKSIVCVKSFTDESGIESTLKNAIEILGGPGKFIRTGDKVLIKPNLCTKNKITGWKGEVTNPKFVEAVIKMVIDAGGKPIVADGCGDPGIGGTDKLAQEIGLTDICKKYNVNFIDLNTEDYDAVKVKNPFIFDEMYISKTVMACDKFISVPVFKIHHATTVTLGMKNLVGILSQKYYAYNNNIVRNKLHDMENEFWRMKYGDEFRKYSKNVWWTPLSATVVDANTARTPDLTLIDGTFGMEGKSPTGGDFVDIKQRSGKYLLVAGADVVATDTVCAKIMMQPAERTPKFKLAELKGLGNTDMKKISVIGEKISDVKVPFRTPTMF